MIENNGSYPWLDASITRIREDLREILALDPLSFPAGSKDRLSRKMDWLHCQLIDLIDEQEAISRLTDPPLYATMGGEGGRAGQALPSTS